MKAAIATILSFLLSGGGLATALSTNYSPDEQVIVPAPGLVTGLPGLDQTSARQYAGQVKVGDGHCENDMFYWFVESGFPTAATDPIIVWLNGNPLGTGMSGFFRENGPFKIVKGTNDALELKVRPDSLKRKANHMIIEQFAGTGFSFSTDPKSCTPKNEEESTEQLYTAFQKIFKNIPGYADNDLYIHGESLEGHYIARIAKLIVSKNRKIEIGSLNEGIKLHLKGVGIGNGNDLLALQFNELTHLAYDYGFINDAGKKELQQIYEACESQRINNTCELPGSLLISLDEYKTKKASIYASAMLKCSDWSSKYSLMMKGKFKNVSSVAEFNAALVAQFLNQKPVREALHISMATPIWGDTPPEEVARNFKADTNNLMHYYIKNIRVNASVRVLIYEPDLYLGCYAMTLDDHVQNFKFKYWLADSETEGRPEFENWKRGNEDAGFSYIGVYSSIPGNLSSDKALATAELFHGIRETTAKNSMSFSDVFNAFFIDVGLTH